MPSAFARRKILATALGAAAALVYGLPSAAQSSKLSFAKWVETFRARARRAGFPTRP